MSDQFASLVAANRGPIKPGAMIIDTPFGQYVNNPDATGADKVLRLKTLDELQADWCIQKMCWQNCEDDMNANAIACKRFHGNPETQHLADRHSARHYYYAENYGRWENACIAIQEEMLWRLDHPEYDPDDPFRDE